MLRTPGNVQESGRAAHFIRAIIVGISALHRTPRQQQNPHLHLHRWTCSRGSTWAKSNSGRGEAGFSTQPDVPGCGSGVVEGVVSLVLTLRMDGLRDRLELEVSLSWCLSSPRRFVGSDGSGDRDPTRAASPSRIGVLVSRSVSSPAGQASRIQKISQVLLLRRVESSGPLASARSGDKRLWSQSVSQSVSQLYADTD